MCEMVMNVQGKTDDYVKLEKDGLGVDFVGAGNLRYLLNIDKTWKKQKLA